MTGDFAATQPLWQQLVQFAPHFLELCRRPTNPGSGTSVNEHSSTGATTRRWVSALSNAPQSEVSPLTACSLSSRRQPAWALCTAARRASPHSCHTCCPRCPAGGGRRELAKLVPQNGRPAMIIDSFKGIDLIITATLLAEAPAAIARADLQALRTFAGTAPVTRRSGKSHTVVMRRSCNPRLRNAVRNWARTAVRWDRHASDLYRAARGLDHERFLRGVADRLLACLVARLHNDAIYDPDRCRPRESLTLP